MGIVVFIVKQAIFLMKIYDSGRNHVHKGDSIKFYLLHLLTSYLSLSDISDASHVHPIATKSNMVCLALSTVRNIWFRCTVSRLHISTNIT